MKIQHLLLSICLTILLPFVTNAQSQIDSLKNVLRASQHDTTTINVYMQLGKEFGKTNSDSAIVYLNMALSIAEQNEWRDKQAKVLTNISMVYYKNGNHDQLFNYLFMALDLFKESGNIKEEMNAHYRLGYFYAVVEKFPQSIKKFKTAMKIALELDDKKRLSGIYNNLGLMYNYAGKSDSAIVYQFKSLEVGEKIGAEHLEYTHINIAQNYHDQGEYKKSIKHNRIALETLIKRDDKKYIAVAYKNIGDDFSKMAVYDSAKYYFNKAFPFYKELNDQVSIARYYMVMGNISAELGKQIEATSLYQKAIDTMPENSSSKLLFAIYSNKAELNLELVDSTGSNKTLLLNEVISMGNIMEEIAVELGSIDKEAVSYGHLYKGYWKKGDFQEAIKYADKFITVKDSLTSKNKQEIIEEMQTKYETEQKEKEILKLENESITKTAEINRQKLIRNVLIVGVIIFSFLIIIIYRFYLQTKKQNIKLIEQNAIILKQKEEKELLVKEIHHRVKNNLQIISSLFDLQMRSTDNPDTKSALIDGLNRVKSVGLIHQLLYQSDDVINVKFEDFVEKLVVHISSFSSDKPIEKSIVIPKGIQFDIATTIPLGLIITELLTNSFKYAFEEVETCSISINLETIEDNRYQLEISDNGSGLPKEFDFNSSKSLGLRLVRTLAKQLSGEIDYKYKNGANFLLTFSKRVSHE